MPTVDLDALPIERVPAAREWATRDRPGVAAPQRSI